MPWSSSVGHGSDAEVVADAGDDAGHRPEAGPLHRGQTLGEGGGIPPVGRRADQERAGVVELLDLLVGEDRSLVVEDDLVGLGVEEVAAGRPGERCVRRAAMPPSLPTKSPLTRPVSSAVAAAITSSIVVGGAMPFSSSMLLR